MPVQENYTPHLVEMAVQTKWEKQNAFIAHEDTDKTKFYCLSMLPYPSGGIHMGHVRNYTIGDVIARYQRMMGKNVIQPMGWDAFGLPAENAALQHHLPPAEWTYKNIEHMRVDLKRLGYAIDWQREVTACKPEYYRWEQWLFLRLYAKGLAYKKKTAVNWDPIDQTVLANEQVIDGRGWRSGAMVERREISQWFLKITAYAEELLAFLDKLAGWPDEVRTMQRNWIGRSEGIELNFKLENTDEKILVFTTRPDTLFGVTYLAIAPQHPLALSAATNNSALVKFIEKCQHIKVAEADLATLEKEGVYTGLNCIHPLTGEILPIWAANFVLQEYGSGAVMSVPAHDQRDFEFALKYGLEIKPVIAPKDNADWNFSKAAFTAEGILHDSATFSDLESTSAISKIAAHIERSGVGKRKIHYRLRDWGISRQRYWGTPIPMIECQNCGTVPVNESDLPVILPENIILKDPRSPLSSLPNFYEVVCPKCKGKARREIDTFDTFMESSWYYARYCCPNQNKAMLDSRVDYWLPVDQYIGGIEHAILHLLYARFIHKAMRDLDLVHCDEPFTNLLTQGMVLKDGTKMSKSRGNTISPQEMIKKYGADTVRLFIIFAAPPQHSLEWSTSGIEGAHRFLKKLWNFSYSKQNFLKNQTSTDISQKQLTFEQKKNRRHVYELLKQANADMMRLQFNTVVSAAMKLLNILTKMADKPKENAFLLSEGFGILLRLLAPIVPHIADHLWHECKFKGDIIDAKWPEVAKEALISETIEMMVQVNGKLRGKITLSKDASKEMIEKAAANNENAKKFISGSTIKKTIIVAERLINLITNVTQ